jgi:hypothetical protein
MSFDVFLQHFDSGKPAEVDRRPVREVLRSAKRCGPDDFGFYRIAFPDGVEVDFSGDGLESDEGSFDGCAFNIRRFGDGLMKFMFDIAHAGDMVIIPAMGGKLVVLVSDQQKTNLPADLREEFQSIVVGSAGELGAVLSGGFNGWSAYRNQVLGRSQPEGEA